METMLSMTIEYMKTRVQFGKPIGENQALQRRATEMMIAMEQGRNLAMLAAVMIDDDNAEQRAHDLSATKVGVGQAARFVSQNAVQLHGGIGADRRICRQAITSAAAWSSPTHRLWRHRLPPLETGGADQRKRPI